MRFRRGLKLLAAGACAAAVTGLGPASAQYTFDPFFDATVMQSRAIGFELAGLRLKIVRAQDDTPYDPLLTEAIEPLAESDYHRFGGLLGDLDAELAEELYEVLLAIAEGVEANEWVGQDVVNVMAHVPIGLVLLEDAYDLVVPPEVRDDPVFKAGIITQLLLGEGGAAEGLEEAVLIPEERWEYAMGWSATQRVKQLWEDIRPLASEQQQADIDEMLAALDAIYPSMEPKTSFAGLDPEEAEGPAQRIVGILETIVDAQLYSGRDQARLIAHLVTMTEQACTLFAEGGWPDWTAPNPPPMPQQDLEDPNLIMFAFGPNDFGREIINAVFDHYAGETTGLGEIVNLFDPEIHERAILAFRSMISIELNPGDPGTGGPALGNAAIQPAGQFGGGFTANATPALACDSLLQALVDAQALFGG